MTRLARLFDISRFERRRSGIGELGILSPLVSRRQPNAQTIQAAFDETSSIFTWQRLKHRI
jgi:hypothetical protein